jgi:hypothetical protein
MRLERTFYVYSDSKVLVGVCGRIPTTLQKVGEGSDRSDHHDISPDSRQA